MLFRTQAGNVVKGITTLLNPRQTAELRSVMIDDRHAYQREYDRAKLEAHVCEAKRLLYLHAYETVPFYRELWRNAGLTPRDFQSTSSSELIPSVSKAQLQQQSKGHLLSSMSCPAALSRTSGTTAKPSVHFKDERSRVLNHLTVRRYFRDYHIPTGSTVLFVHSEHRAPVRKQSVASQFFAQRVWVSVSDLIREFRVVRQLDAEVIVGSPQQLLLLAQEVFVKGYVRPPRLLVSIAERLDSNHRHALKRLTGSAIVDVYCASELSTLIAFECHGYGRFHTNSDFILIEVLDANDKPALPGEIGEVVVTDLCNFVSPLIRYRLGDLAKAAGSTGCNCGRALPVQLDSIEGRVTDQIVLDSGHTVSALPLVNELRMQFGANFALVQEDTNLFSFHWYEFTEQVSGAQIDAAQKCILQYVGLNAEVRFQSSCFKEQRFIGPAKVRSYISKVPRRGNLVTVKNQVGALADLLTEPVHDVIS